MKIYFIRNTHDENGNYRGEEYFNYPTDLELRNKYEESEIFFGVHTWNKSGQKLTLEEIHKETLAMIKDGSYEGPYKEKDISILNLLKGLAFMIENKLVTVEFEL